MTDETDAPPSTDIVERLFPRANSTTALEDEHEPIEIDPEVLERDHGVRLEIPDGPRALVQCADAKGNRWTRGETSADDSRAAAEKMAEALPEILIVVEHTDGRREPVNVPAWAMPPLEVPADGAD